MPDSMINNIIRVYHDNIAVLKKLKESQLIIGCILRIQQLSERSLLLVYSSRFIVDLKVYSNYRQ